MGIRSEERLTTDAFDSEQQSFSVRPRDSAKAVVFPRTALADLDARIWEYGITKLVKDRFNSWIKAHRTANDGATPSGSDMTTYLSTLRDQLGRGVWAERSPSGSAYDAIMFAIDKVHGSKAAKKAAHKLGKLDSKARAATIRKVSRDPTLAVAIAEYYSQNADATSAETVSDLIS